MQVYTGKEINLKRKISLILKPGTKQEISYPIYLSSMPLFEKLLVKLKRWPIRCSVCGKLSLMLVDHDNFREGCLCSTCHSFNRQRQIAHVICRSFRPGFKSLHEFSGAADIAVYNTETGGTLHAALCTMKHYVCSEYFGESYQSGKMVNGKMHQDLMHLSFEDNSFDLVISTDVLEHVPDPYQAHREIYRVLKQGGRHIFTVPFYQEDVLDETRSTVDEGFLTHHLEPLYHIDPLRNEGILVFNIFSIEMLVKLRKIGFQANMIQLYKPVLGIVGPNALVFEAIKQ